MKIIGKTDYGFIISISKSEVFNLIGYRIEYQANADGVRPNLNVGDSIEISAMFDRLHSIESNRLTLETCQKQLHAYADLLGSVDPVIKATADGDVNDRT